jgi:hypothetical protein
MQIRFPLRRIGNGDAFGGGANQTTIRLKPKKTNNYRTQLCE